MLAGSEGTDDQRRICEGNGSHSQAKPTVRPSTAAQALFHATAAAIPCSR